MKKYVNLIVLMCLLATGCAKQGVVITIDVLNQPEVNRLIYSAPLSGTIYYGFSDTLKAKETGKFELKLELKQPSFIAIWDERAQNRVKMLVEPECNYHVSIDSTKNVQIAGSNEKGQMLYTTLPDPEYIETESRKWFNYNDTVPVTSIHHQIDELKQSDLSKFKELLDDREITKSFFDLVQKDRDCYYALMETRFLLLKAYESVRREIKIGDDLLQNLKETYEQYPPNDERLLFSSFWPQYAGCFVKEYKQDFDIQKNRELRNEGTYHTHIIHVSSKYLNGKAFEFFQARYLWSECAEFGSMEKELISLFDQFEADYPKSEYSKYIRPFIEKIIDYYQVIEEPFDKDAVFIDNYETFNTLEEAIKPLLGKKIYIDVWATWCGPCKAEFAHNEALKKILAENKIQQLYISIDKEDKDQQWKEMIKFYHLTGLHIRANKVLCDNLMDLYSKDEKERLIVIPWYMLVDEKGNIVDEHAKRPSQLAAGEKLF